MEKSVRFTGIKRYILLVMVVFSALSAWGQVHEIDLELVSIVSPVSGYNLTATEGISIRIKNSGRTLMGGAYECRVSLDGNEIHRRFYSFPPFFTSSKEDIVDLSVTVDFITAKTHTIGITLILGTDLNATNNTKTIVVENYGDYPSPPPPVPAYVVIGIPEVEGIRTIPAAGKHELRNGAPFDLAVEVSDEYDESDIKVLANGVKLEPVPLRGALYSYRIDKVHEYIDLRIEGVEKNDPMGIYSPSDESATRIYTVGRTLYVEVAEKAGLIVYSSSGQLYTQRNLNPGTTSLILPNGIYFVKVNEEVRKIVVSE